MNEMNVGSSPYEAPSADLEVEGVGKGISNFERFSAWGVFGLSFITLGIYPVYWLYTRSKVLNSFSDNEIPLNLLNILIGVVIISFATSFLSGFMPENNSLLTLNGLSSLAYMVLYLVVLFKFRNRLRDITNTKISGIITFFGSAIYLQYKINEAIDGQ